MQFVRPFDKPTVDQYRKIFESDENVIQIDPRFIRQSLRLRPSGNGPFYTLPPDDYRRSCSDVGLLRLSFITDCGFRFAEGERQNKKDLFEKGYLRAFPFTPIAMHMPFPKTYRKGKRTIRRFPFRRGSYSYRDMTTSEMERMDGRPMEDIAYYKTFLRPSNMYLSRLSYALSPDKKIFG